MQLPQLKISSEFAQLGINQTRANIEIHQKHADLKIKQPPPDVEITLTKGKLYIDQSEAFADAGLKHPLRKSKEWAQQSKQKLLSGIATDASQGDQMMKIENGNNAIPQIAKTNSTPKMQDFNLAYVPSSMFQVKFDYQPSELKVDIKTSKPIVKARVNPPEINYRPWQTDIYVKQKQSIHFSVTGMNVDRQL